MKTKIIALAIFAIAAISSTHAQLYSVTDLGTLGGATYADGINNSATIVGQSHNSAFSYSGGSINNLGSLGGSIFAAAASINDSGTIVGTSDLTGDVNAHAFSYSGGVMTDLGTLGGGWSVGYGINSSGVIVGAADTVGGNNSQYHAFSYSGGVMTNLGTLGGSESFAVGINSTGVIVGDSWTTGDAADHAFSYSGGVMTDLGTFGGTGSAAVGVNNSGTIVGNFTLGGVAHAFSYSGGVMTDLGALGGGGTSVGDTTGFYESGELAINSSGQIVGSSNGLAFIYSGGAMTDLNTLLDLSGAGWTLLDASAINDYGQIVGFGTFGGQTHAFLLTPEPSACAMLLGGLGLLGFALRRKLYAERRA